MAVLDYFLLLAFFAAGFAAFLGVDFEAVSAAFFLVTGTFFSSFFTSFFSSLNFRDLKNFFAIIFEAPKIISSTFFVASGLMLINKSSIVFSIESSCSLR